ncbi:MAG TPA: cytochrome B6, partial [Bacteroidota bacterium]|nr:cytochrome B6 [Bacteroidota bacterium]
MKNARNQIIGFLLVAGTLSLGAGTSFGQQKKESSYAPVIEEPFEKVMAQDKSQKAAVMKRQMDLLNERYDLSKRVTTEVTMSKGKPLPVGPTAKLKGGLTWERLNGMTPEKIKDEGLFPYLPLPHPKHASGGMLFTQVQIKQFPRLERFDVDFDLPEYFLPEYPPPLFLTTHKEMGDVSQGRVISIDNYYELFDGILNPKQLEGLRLLLTQFPQQQFNATADRKSEKPSLGVACFDCHVNA